MFNESAYIYSMGQNQKKISYERTYMSLKVLLR